MTTRKRRDTDGMSREQYIAFIDRQVAKEKNSKRQTQKPAATATPAAKEPATKRQTFKVAASTKAPTAITPAVDDSLDTLLRDLSAIKDRIADEEGF